MWALIHLSWMIYVLNIFVSLFSIVLVSQGWLVASNLFDAREAKRLYPLLGMGMVLGAAFGGEFTNRTAHGGGHAQPAAGQRRDGRSGVRGVSRWQRRKSSKAVKEARAAHEEETEFSFGGMFRDIGRTRHLQVIVGIMVAMYLVDTLVEYQFQVSAKSGYTGDAAHRVLRPVLRALSEPHGVRVSALRNRVGRAPLRRRRNASGRAGEHHCCLPSPSCWRPASTRPAPCA